MIKVGIIGIHKETKHGHFSRIGFNYSHFIEQTGIAQPYIIPCNVNNLDHYVADMDMFIFPGGDADIDPSFYDEKNTACHEVHKENDLFLLSFLGKIIVAGKPILGICKGMQLINVFFGGSLIQDIHDKDQHHQIEKQNDYIHTLQLVENSLLHNIYGEKVIEVNSIHHQAIKKLGNHLHAIAHSDDNYIEAIVHEHKKIVGVQWHPENLHHKNAHNQFFKKLLQEYFDI